jgi:carbon-monoxide dehydrogenase medium subunit
MVQLAADGRIEQASVGLTAVGLDGPATRVAALLVGQAPSEQLFAEAGRLASEDCSPTADQRGPVDYKRHLAGELTTRVLRRAAARAAVTSPAARATTTNQEG